MGNHKLSFTKKNIDFNVNWNESLTSYTSLNNWALIWFILIVLSLVMYVIWTMGR